MSSAQFESTGTFARADPPAARVQRDLRHRPVVNSTHLAHGWAWCVDHRARIEALLAQRLELTRARKLLMREGITIPCVRRWGTASTTPTSQMSMRRSKRSPGRTLPRTTSCDVAPPATQLLARRPNATWPRFAVAELGFGKVAPSTPVLDAARSYSCRSTPAE